MNRRRRSRAKRGKLPRRIAFMGIGALGAVVMAIAVWEIFFLRFSELADPSSVRTIEVPVGKRETRSLVVGPKNPYWTPLGAVSRAVIVAVVKAEDARFFQHAGFDWKELRDSFDKNLEEGGFSRGGSTITMQLAKNLFLWRRKSLFRKGLEAYLAWRLESTLPKKRILELYLNVVEWGDGVYGIGEASRHYFKKAPSDLTLGEAALLAAILPSPVRWSPDRAPAFALRRQQELLSRLRRENAVAEIGEPTPATPDRE